MLQATLGDLRLGVLTPVEGVKWTLSPSRGGISGWGGPTSTMRPVQRPRGHGSWAGQAWLGSRVMTLSGIMRADTPELASTALDTLNNAASLSGARLTVHETGRDLYVTVRRRGPVDWVWVTETFVQWSVDLEAVDPRKFPLGGDVGASRPVDTAWVNYSRDPSFEYGVGVLSKGTSVSTVTQSSTVSGDDGPGSGADYAVVTGTTPVGSVAQSFILQYYGTGFSGTNLVAEGDYVGIGARFRCPDGSATHVRLKAQFRTDASVLQTVSGPWEPLTAAPLTDPATLRTHAAGPAPATTTRASVLVEFAGSADGVTPAASGFLVHTDMWIETIAPTLAEARSRAGIYFDGDGTVVL